LIGFAGTALGMMIGSIAVVEKTALFLMLIIIWPIFIFAGYQKNRIDYPTWIRWYE